MLIDKEYVFKYFPLWIKFFQNDENNPDQEILESEMELSEAEFSRYLTRTESDITAGEKVHLLNILRKRGYDRLHGDAQMEFKPQIVWDYTNTIAALKTASGPVLISANDKKFAGGNWFNEEAEQ